MRSCIFSNNTSLGIANRTYSGNAGGMAIGYDENFNNEPDYHPYNIMIIYSIFECNQADANGSADFEREASLLLRQRIFKQRGGGIALYFGTKNTSVHVEILQSSFIGNYAKSAGGGLYILLEGENHTITIHDCNFTSNSAYVGAGIEIAYNTDTYDSFSATEILPHTAILTDSIFIRNNGEYGGAVSNSQLGYLNILTVKNCTFMENSGSVGAAIYLQLFSSVLSFSPERKIVIEDWYVSINIRPQYINFTINIILNLIL